MGYKLKRIMMRPNGVEKQVRPSIDTRTFTITRTEKSDMSSGWTYSDDAAGLTAGSTDFDEFFGYSGVRLNTSGQETAEITQTASGGAGKLDITQLGTLTSGDNVMIKFPVRGIKMTKSGSTVTLSITDELNKAGYQYYAHSRGTTIKNNLYLGTYKGYNNSNVIKSWSGKSPTLNLSIGNTRTYSNNNGAGYDSIAFYQRQYINALYMMKYGNPNSGSVIGKGYIGGAGSNTGMTDSQTNATYGTTAGKYHSKLFGIEDRRGFYFEWLDGIYFDSNGNFLVNKTNQNFVDSPSAGVDYINTGIQFGTINSMTDTRAVSGTNNGMFLPTTLSGNTGTQYYCTQTYLSKSQNIMACGAYGAGYDAGLFTITGRDASGWSINGCRLMYL